MSELTVPLRQAMAEIDRAVGASRGTVTWAANEIDRLTKERDRARVVLAALVAHEDTGCVLDHDGDCQAHLCGEVDGECAVPVARRLLGLDTGSET